MIESDRVYSISVVPQCAQLQIPTKVPAVPATIPAKPAKIQTATVPARTVKVQKKLRDIDTWRVNEGKTK